VEYNCINFVRRYENNPILTAKDFPDRYVIAHCFNSGITKFNGKYLMVCRVEDAALNAYFWIAESGDGIHFTPRKSPIRMPRDNPEFMRYAQVNYYDPRVTKIDDVYYIMHACHSSFGPRISLLKTRDFESFDWMGYVSDPGNRNGALFPEKIDGCYVRLDRPMSSWDSGDMWISYSPDLIHWGRSTCIMKNTDVSWAWSKVGAGAPPVRIKEGWLNVFHGVRTQCKSHYVYQLGVCLHDGSDPSKIIALGKKPILMPMKDYELHGQTPSVVFSSGCIVEDNGEVKIYYGGADSVQCIGFTTVEMLLDVCYDR
jgi:predicted GH43/DUF377 family glycosyl hydrolase